MVNVVSELLFQFVDFRGDAGVDVEIAHLDLDAADDLGVQQLVDFNSILGLICNHTADFLHQFRAQRLGTGKGHDFDFMEFVVIFDEFFADGVQHRFAFFADDDIQKREGCFVEDFLEYACENDFLFGGAITGLLRTLRNSPFSFSMLRTCLRSLPTASIWSFSLAKSKSAFAYLLAILGFFIYFLIRAANVQNYLMMRKKENVLLFC